MSRNRRIAILSAAATWFVIVVVVTIITRNIVWMGFLGLVAVILFPVRRRRS